MFSRFLGLFSRVPQQDDSIALLEHDESDDIQHPEINAPYQSLYHAGKINQLIAHLHEVQCYIPQHRISLRRKLMIYSILLLGTSLTLLAGSATFISIATKVQLEAYNKLIEWLKSEYTRLNLQTTSYWNMLYDSFQAFHGSYHKLHLLVIDLLVEWSNEKNCFGAYDLSSYLAHHDYPHVHAWIDTEDLILGRVCSEEALNIVDISACRKILESACNIINNDTDTLYTALVQYKNYKRVESQLHESIKAEMEVKAAIEKTPYIQSGAVIAGYVLIPLIVIATILTLTWLFIRKPVRTYRASIQSHDTLQELLQNEEITPLLTYALNSMRIPFNPQMKVESLDKLLKHESELVKERHARRLAFFSASLDPGAGNHAFVINAGKDVKNIILEMADLSSRRSRFN